jgi:hypothetical protein
MKVQFAVAVAALVLSGCSIKHDVVKDYPQYLVNNQAESHLPATSAASSYLVTPATQAHHYEFRSAMAGYANVWVVEFGRMLDERKRGQVHLIGRITVSEPLICRNGVRVTYRSLRR